MGRGLEGQVEQSFERIGYARSSRSRQAHAPEYSSFRPHPWVRLAKTGHLLTPFIDDAEGRSHDASNANRNVIEINRKKRRTGHCHSIILTRFQNQAQGCDVPRRSAAKAGERATLDMPGQESINPESGRILWPPATDHRLLTTGHRLPSSDLCPRPQALERFITC